MSKETLTQQKLGLRLRMAREAVGLTQAQVARHLKTSRSTVAQIELGNRGVESLELVQLALLYHRDLQGLVSPAAPESDPVKILMRADAGVNLDSTTRRSIAWCHELSRVTAELERLLEIGERRAAPPSYQVANAGSKWQAIQEGNRLAIQERSRLRLGDAPVREMAALLETQGVTCAELPLPRPISGVFIAPSLHSSPCVLANSSHHLRRRLFSYAHEYCHVLVDRPRVAGISHDGNQDEYSEVRANAFAAAFLIPEEGVLAVLASRGKLPARTVEMLAEDGGQRIKGRPPKRPSDDDIQIYDVVAVADHFGVSYKSIVFRLRNIGLLTEERLEFLLSLESQARGLQGRSPSPSRQAGQREVRLRRRFLELAIEAYRQEQISWKRLLELASLARYSAREAAAEVTAAGLSPGPLPHAGDPASKG